MPVGVQCPISSSLGEFPSYRDWLWCPGLSPVLVSWPFARIGVHRPSRRFPYSVFSIRPYLPLDGAHEAENSIQISALAGVEPRTLASSGRAPLLLVASYDMQDATGLQQDNSNPEPAGVVSHNRRIKS